MARSRKSRAKAQITLDECLAGCEKLQPLRQADGPLEPGSETHRERWTRKLTESRERNRVRKLEVDTDTALKKRAKAILEDSDD